MMEAATGLTRLQRIMGDMARIQPRWNEEFNALLSRRLQGEPTQYILGTAAFFGRDFFVTPDVLIPRPETELLVEWVVQCARLIPNPRILDLGTGSGCIATTLALELPGSKVTAIDISLEALAVAKKNATTLGADVSFLHADMLLEAPPAGDYDLIVSNPPYIPEVEKTDMQREVLDHEPHLALFPGDDVLLFYRRLAEIGPDALGKGGWMAMEMHSGHAREACALFERKPFSELMVHRDLAGLDRFVTVGVDAS